MGGWYVQLQLSLLDEHTLTVTLVRSSSERHCLTLDNHIVQSDGRHCIVVIDSSRQSSRSFFLIQLYRLHLRRFYYFFERRCLPRRSAGDKVYHPQGMGIKAEPKGAVSLGSRFERVC
jgi:hypothetical protein